MLSEKGTKWYKNRSHSDNHVAIAQQLQLNSQKCHQNTLNLHRDRHNLQSNHELKN